MVFLKTLLISTAFLIGFFLIFAFIFKGKKGLSEILIFSGSLESSSYEMFRDKGYIHLDFNIR